MNAPRRARGLPSTAMLALLSGAPEGSLASAPRAWAAADARSAAECAASSGLDEPRVGAPLRFSDEVGFDLRVVTGIAPQPHRDGESVTVLCAFDRRTGVAEVVEAPDDALVTALPSAPSIEGIVWRAEDIGGGGIIDRSYATLTLGTDGRIVGSASCNAYSGGYVLERGALRITSPLVATRKACAASLMDQERRFLAILGAASHVELLPTGALLASVSDGRSLRFFPEHPLRPADAPTPARAP